MNVKKLEASIQILKDDLGAGLLRCDVWKTGSGQAIAGINGNPKGVALFEEVTADIVKSLANGGYPKLNDFYLIDLNSHEMLVVVMAEGYQWSIEIDKEKTNMGLLLSVAIPDVKTAFHEALAG